MVTFKISKTLQIAWKIVKSCVPKKNDEKIILSEVEVLLKKVNPYKKEYDFLRNVLKDNFENIIVIAVMIYPNKNLGDAIKNLYEDIKFITDKYGLENEKINKFLRVDTSKLKNDFFKPTTISKIAFIDKIIKIKKKEECIFN